MNTRKVIDAIEILRAFHGGATSISDIEASCSKSRSTIQRFLDDAEGWKLVIRTTSGYERTAAGDLVLQQYDELEEQTRSEISSLVEFEYGPILLGILSDSPSMGKAEMARRSGASRSTVQRNMRKFHSDDYSWLNKQDGQDQLSDKGEHLVGYYESLDEKFEIIEGKAEFLERYTAGLLPPLEALASSRMVVSTTGYRFSSDWTFSAESGLLIAVGFLKDEERIAE